MALVSGWGLAVFARAVEDWEAGQAHKRPAAGSRRAQRAPGALHAQLLPRTRLPPLPPPQVGALPKQIRSGPCRRRRHRQVTEAQLLHDLEDAWRLQDGALGCIPAGLLDGLPPTGTSMFGAPGLGWAE